MFILEREIMLLLFLPPLFLHSQEEHWQSTLDLLLIALLTSKQKEPDLANLSKKWY